MALGWVDFSKSERNKVLSVLDMLSEGGTLDELGIAPIRDGFANLFFPGTSTIQTRAKYFLIVPYAFKNMEYSKESNPNQILRTIDNLERKCGEILLQNKEDTDGIIGSRSLNGGRWVKRTPADIYWAGLRNYGIFTAGNMSLDGYIRAMCYLKDKKANLSNLGNRNSDAEENECDDKDAGDISYYQFWNIPTYSPDWMQDLSIKLSEEEGVFLKERICSSYPKSMMANILNNDMTDILEVDYFQSLNSVINIFPDQIQSAFHLSFDFSYFLYVIRVIYNIIVSDGLNETANQEWERILPELNAYSEVDLDSIYDLLQIHRNPYLCMFLRKCRELMKKEDLEGLKTEIKRRERELKQSRAKTLHPGELPTSDWYGGGLLDYRFSSARVIMRDIFESEGRYA